MGEACAARAAAGCGLCCTCCGWLWLMRRATHLAGVVLGAGVAAHPHAPHCWSTRGGWLMAENARVPCPQAQRVTRCPAAPCWAAPHLQRHTSEQTQPVVAHGAAIVHRTIGRGDCPGLTRYTPQKGLIELVRLCCCLPRRWRSLQTMRAVSRRHGPRCVSSWLCPALVPRAHSAAARRHQAAIVLAGRRQGNLDVKATIKILHPAVWLPTWQQLDLVASLRVEHSEGERTRPTPTALQPCRPPTTHPRVRVSQHQHNAERQLLQRAGQRAQWTSR